MPSRKQNKGLSLYNKILKQFTKLNSQLPENQKLSIEERRNIISGSIYPQLKGLPAKKNHTLKNITFKLEGIIEQIPVKEICDVNYIDPTVYAIVPWHDIDEFIQNIIPDCVFVQVNAGEHGKTKIFNTRNYSYYRSGVKSIIENLREFTEDTSELDFTGYRKLKKNKTNDGSPENYYIEFILNINGNSIGDTTTVDYIVPKDQRSEQRKVRDIINERIRRLKSQKRNRKRARNTFKKNMDKVRKQAARQKKSKKPQSVAKAFQEKVAAMNAAIAQVEKDFKKGLLTKEQRDAYVKQIYKYFK